MPLGKNLEPVSARHASFDAPQHCAIVVTTCIINATGQELATHRVTIHSFVRALLVEASSVSQPVYAPARLRVGVHGGVFAPNVLVAPVVLVSRDRRARPRLGGGAERRGAVFNRRRRSGCATRPRPENRARLAAASGRPDETAPAARHTKTCLSAPPVYTSCVSGFVATAPPPGCPRSTRCTPAALLFFVARRLAPAATAAASGPAVSGRAAARALHRCFTFGLGFGFAFAFRTPRDGRKPSSVGAARKNEHVPFGGGVVQTRAGRVEGELRRLARVVGGVAEVSQVLVKAAGEVPDAHAIVRSRGRQTQAVRRNRERRDPPRVRAPSRERVFLSRPCLSFAVSVRASCRRAAEEPPSTPRRCSKTPLSKAHAPPPPPPPPAASAAAPKAPHARPGTRRRGGSRRRARRAPTSAGARGRCPPCAARRARARARTRARIGPRRTRRVTHLVPRADFLVRVPAEKSAKTRRRPGRRARRRFARPTRARSPRRRRS